MKFHFYERKRVDTLLTVLLFSDLCYGIRWLGLNIVDQPWSEPKHCPRSKVERKKYGLVSYQLKLCRRLSDMMPVIMRASQMTSYVCQLQFSDRRWNCSSIALAPNYKPDLTKGTREQAYVYALSSAAVTHQVAKACVSGEIAYCPCGANGGATDGSFKWKGCSDNVQYGQRVSKEWADAPWKRKTRGRSNRGGNNNNNNHNKFAQQTLRGDAIGGRGRDNQHHRHEEDRIGHGYTAKDGAGGTVVKTDGRALYSRRRQERNRLYSDMAIMSMEDFMRNSDYLTPRAKMNQHNNDVGRELTRQLLFRKCKCHGVSSSCSVRTCWHTLPDMNYLAMKLKERYIQAIEVRAMNKPHRQQQTRSAFEPVALTTAAVNDDNLVYVRKSPDYCTADTRVGSEGTLGRQCNASSSDHFGCDTMCCGRGYTTEEVGIVEQCECKYVHCCYVKCKQCEYVVSKYYCK